MKSFDYFKFQINCDLRVSTETTTLRTDELKEKDCINNTESNAHVKSVLATGDEMNANSTN